MQRASVHRRAPPRRERLWSHVLTRTGPDEGNAGASATRPPTHPPTPPHHGGGVHTGARTGFVHTRRCARANMLACIHTCPGGGGRRVSTFAPVPVGLNMLARQATQPLVPYTPLFIRNTYFCPCHSWRRRIMCRHKPRPCAPTRTQCKYKTFNWVRCWQPLCRVLLCTCYSIVAMWRCKCHYACRCRCYDTCCRACCRTLGPLVASSPALRLAACCSKDRIPKECSAAKNNGFLRQGVQCYAERHVRGAA